MEGPSIFDFDDRVLAFSEEASAELERQEDLLEMVKLERSRQWRGTLFPLLLMILSGLLLLQYPKALWSWFISSLLLYSWNFVFLLLPTTRKKVRNSGNVVKMRRRDQRVGAVLKHLLRKPKLVLEIIITLFLGRMVPLTVGFTIILGTGMIVLMTFVLNGHIAVAGLTRLIVLQVVLILTFYLLVNLLEPQSQGVSRIARSWAGRMGMAKRKGPAASFLVKAAAVAVIVVVAIIFIGALILPGYTFITLLTSLKELGVGDVLLFAGIFAEQFWLMRSFQSFTSVRMANELLNERIDKLQGMLERAKAIRASSDRDLDRCDALRSVIDEFYSLMLYDVYRTDLFGRSPVYLVGPRMKYIFDDKVLCHVP